ncbi:MAG: CDP-4-dehydro-6-deoxyglucose reductase [Cyclobacteriaceae bacterium]|jgi:CDP-4-dehydro-6-deoxyglucose reductase
MFEITLKNDKKFLCDKDTTIFLAAKSAGIFLEHSCLTARCRSCIVRIEKGETVNQQDEFVLSDEERQQNFVLSCNAKPISNLDLTVEDLGNVVLHEKKIVPAKISRIELMNSDVIKVTLRLPPTANFRFISGQYVNLIKGTINRSYSIASSSSKHSELEFFIKKYENGLMSQYWFHEAKANDLLRLEGPLGSFFVRETRKKNLIFLATGTGIAPIKAILDELEINGFEAISDKKIWIFVGARYKEDLFWIPKTHMNVFYIPTLSKASSDWNGEKGYVQDSVLRHKIDLTDAQVYACGSNQMIASAKKILTENSLDETQFYSDAFVQTN